MQQFAISICDLCALERPPGLARRVPRGQGFARRTTQPDPEPRTRKAWLDQPDLGRLSERTLGGSSPPATCGAQITKDPAENEPRIFPGKSARLCAPHLALHPSNPIRSVILRRGRSTQPRPRGAAQHSPPAPCGNQAARRSDAASMRLSTSVPVQQSGASSPH